MFYTEDKQQELYLDWINNFITTKAFAKHHAISEGFAKRTIDAGRVIHERRAAEAKPLELVELPLPQASKHKLGAWTSVVPILLNILEQGDGTGKEMARKEIMRLATAVDALNNKEG